MSLPRILVVGGGAGGLELVTSLGKKLGKKGLAKIYLADGKRTHVWKPRLHELATGTLNTGEDEVNYFTHANKSGYRFRIGWMNGLDRQRKVIKTDAIHDLEGNEVSGPREFRYDKLVLAVGSKTNSFGTPGVDEHCLKLDSQFEAEKLRKRFLAQALALTLKKMPKLRIGIVGAGPTGVELAAEIHHTMNEIKSYGAAITGNSLEITVIEAAPTILPGMPPHMSEFAHNELTKRGIHVMTEAKIKEVTENGFVMGNGEVLETDMKIWTAGAKAPDWLNSLGLQSDQINRIKVNGQLQSVDDSDIYAIGDCAHSTDARNPGKPLAPTAQCAHQQAEYLATKIFNDVREKDTPKPFMYNSQGMLVSLGTTTAVGSIPGIMGMGNRNLEMRGRKAKILYSSLYRMHQASIYGRLQAGCIFLGDQLRSTSLPTLKLH